MIPENDLWLLSFYRLSEINGALFFGKLAGALRNEEFRAHMTRHFSEEAQHAWYWTQCIQELGAQPLQLDRSYQDQYLVSIGLPANMMEVLAITQVFERRVISHYAQQAHRADTHSLVRTTICRIMQDERWHLEWVSQALRSLESEYGREHIKDTLRRYRTIDKEIYQRLLTEHDERFCLREQGRPSLSGGLSHEL
jgi:rubrerythrin